MSVSADRIGNSHLHNGKKLTTERPSTVHRVRMRKTLRPAAARRHTHKPETSAGESQGDSIPQPRVASPRATLGVANKARTTLKGLRHGARHLERNDATPLALKTILRSVPRVGARRANPKLNDTIPLGLSEALADLWVMTSARTLG